jgi:carbonic anhydrase/acetyltransferase-like protein (isoleucine patch superfamily)
MIILPYLDFTPKIDPSVSAERWTAVIGRAQVGAGTRLGQLVTLRADGERIDIGPDCWFGDFSTVHIADSVYASSVGQRVTVGRYGLVHACAIDDDCLIGEHAVVMDGCTVGKGAVIAAESLVPPGKALEGGWLYAGSPARPVEQISKERLALLHRALRGGGDSGPQADLVRARNYPLAAMRHATGGGLHEADRAYIAPSATVIGKVELAPSSSIWFQRRGRRRRRARDPGRGQQHPGQHPRVWRRGGGRRSHRQRVTVGHNVRMEACEIEDNTIIGMGSIIGKGTVVREGAVVAAGSVTEPGTIVERGMIWSGRPQRAARSVIGTESCVVRGGRRCLHRVYGEVFARSAKRAA